MSENRWTVQEASEWLTCEQPVSLDLLRVLGRDCSMVCRIYKMDWVDKPTPGQPWPTERAYPLEVLKEVFSRNPKTAPYMP